MGRKGGKKYRREIRKEQSERDKDALFWKLGKQLSDPLGEYREFIANIRNKEFNEVDDYIDIPINLVDLTANLITSLITGENCLYESINESDKRIHRSHEEFSDIEEEEEEENKEKEEKKEEEKKEEEKEEKSISNSNSKSKSKENINNENNEIKFTKFKPNSNSSTFQKNKSYSFNFEEYCQHENEESFHFIRKIIKKTQLSLTTFIVGLFFIYSYKHMEKDKRKHREHKVSKYITDWSMTSPKRTKKKKRKRKNKSNNNSNNDSHDNENDGVLNEKKMHSSQETKSEDDSNNKINKSENTNKIYSLDNNLSTEFSSDSNHKINSSNIRRRKKSKNKNKNKNNKNNNENNNENNNKNNNIVSPILKTEFLSSFQPRNQTPSNISKCSSVEDSINNAMTQYPSPSHSNNNDEETIDKNDDKIDNNDKNHSHHEIHKESEDDDTEDEDDEDDDKDDNEDDENSDDDEYEKSILYQQRMHRRHNSRFNSLIKNENFSKNFSYLSSCYILSDRYGSYVIPTFLASIIVADKLLYDATYTNLNWSEFTEGRYTLEDINELERRFLSIMNFQLFISQKKFDEFLSYLDFILCLQKIRAWGSIPFALSYSDIYTLTKKIDSKYFDAYPNNKNNTYDILKKVFKIILGILLIYLIVLFAYILWKNYN